MQKADSLTVQLDISNERCEELERGNGELQVSIQNEREQSN